MREDPTVHTVHGRQRIQSRELSGSAVLPDISIYEDVLIGIFNVGS